MFPVGEGALHCVAFGGSTEAAEVLLCADAEVDARDEYGKTPLHTAAFRGHTDVATALLHAGAEVDAWSKKRQTRCTVRPSLTAERWSRCYCAPRQRSTQGTKSSGRRCTKRPTGAAQRWQRRCCVPMPTWTQGATADGRRCTWRWTTSTGGWCPSLWHGARTSPTCGVQSRCESLRRAEQSDSNQRSMRRFQ